MVFTAPYCVFLASISAYFVHLVLLQQCPAPRIVAGGRPSAYASGQISELVEWFFLQTRKWPSTSIAALPGPSAGVPSIIYFHFIYIEREPPWQGENKAPTAAHDGAQPITFAPRLIHSPAPALPFTNPAPVPLPIFVHKFVIIVPPQGRHPAADSVFLGPNPKQRQTLFLPRRRDLSLC